MRIIEIIPRLFPVGGAETLFTNLVIEVNREFQNNSNNEVICVFLYKGDGSFLYQRLAEAGIRTITLSKKKGLDIRCAHQLRKVINIYKPDVIHTHLNVLLTLRLALGNNHAGIRVFHTFHSIAMNTGGVHQELLLRFLLKTSWMVPIGVSNEVSRTIESFYNIKNVSAVNNGIDLSQFDSSNPIKERENYFLCVGRFVDLKNQLFAIKCFSAVFKKFPSVNLVLVGTGPNLEACKAYSSSIQLEDSVRFVGASSEVPTIMSKSKVLLLPSLYEGNPMVINEAMASGMFIIANRVGGISDIVDKRNGILTKVNSRESFISAMNYAISNIDSIEQIRLINAETAKEHSIEKCTKSYIAIFSEKNDSEAIATVK